MTVSKRRSILPRSNHWRHVMVILCLQWQVSTVVSSWWQEAIESCNPKPFLSTASSSDTSNTWPRARLLDEDDDSIEDDPMRNEEYWNGEDMDLFGNGDEPVAIPSLLGQGLSRSSLLRVHVTSAPPNEDCTNSPTIFKAPSLRSTGTTIVGLIVEDAVVLAADTRATDDTMVADKRCEKIHFLTPTVVACGAGTSADLEQLTRHCRYSLKLSALVEETIGNQHESVDGSKRCCTGMTAVCRWLQDELLEKGGSLGANLIVGGIHHSTRQPQLVALHPHGSMDVDLPYAALGSGGLAAMAVLERNYRPDMTLAEGIALVKRSVVAGILNDLGSGSQVDLCILRNHKPAQYQRCVVPEVSLPPDDTAESAAALEESDPDKEGVNGFGGNLPYVVKSRRFLKKNAASDEAPPEWINGLLDLE